MLPKKNFAVTKINCNFTAGKLCKKKVGLLEKTMI